MPTLLEIGLCNALMATVLALPAAAVSHLRRWPALAHALWLLVLLKLLTPPLVLVHLPWSIGSESPATEAAATGSRLDMAAGASEPGPVSAEEMTFGAAPGIVADPADVLDVSSEEESATAPVEGQAAPGSPPISWAVIAAPAWVAGSLLWFAWALFHIRRFERLLRHAGPAPVEIQQQAQRLAARLGLKRSLAVWLVPGAVAPMVWAIAGRPRLLFPARLLHQLDEEQRAALLLHELAHVRRRDHWVRVLELVATGLYWWHPLVWWARREMHEAEEQCCDAWVVSALAGSSRAYALALLQTVAFFSHARSPVPVAASGIGPVSHLRRRLTMIMQATTSRSLSWGGCLAVFGLGLFLLPLLPVQAQQGPRPADDRKPAAKDAVDKEIEALKKQIQALEQRKLAEAADALRKATDALPPNKGVDPRVRAAVEWLGRVQAADALPKEVDPKELDQAREEVKRLRNQMEEKRREFTEATRRYQEAQGRLARLEGASKAHRAVAEKLHKAELKYATRQDKKATDLEQRLERLAKELEELRRELRQEKSRP